MNNRKLTHILEMVWISLAALSFLAGLYNWYHLGIGEEPDVFCDYRSVSYHVFLPQKSQKIPETLVSFRYGLLFIILISLCFQPFFRVWR
jgi:hypothetical protein